MNEYSFSEKTVESKRILYTPSSFAREDLFHLQETGTLTAITTHSSHRSNLTSYLFFVILNGSGRLVYKGEEFLLSQGDCVFIDCNNPYIHETSKDFWTLQWTHFYGPGVAGIYNKYCERGGRPVFRPVSISKFVSVQNNLYSMAVSDDYLRDMRINELLSSLLTLIMENSWNTEHQKQTVSDNTASILAEVKEYLDFHYKEKLILDELSEMFYMNKYYMIRLFKSIYGDTIINYQIKQRINAAKRMLRFSDLSIESVGYECGFDDPNYFSRIFKKIEGSSPSVYRNTWREH